jgi:uncharacterized protein YraI
MKNLLKPFSTVVVAASLLLSATPAFAQTPAPAQIGVNLLTNPGHEHPGAYFAGRGEINVTWNWVPFWEEPPAGFDLRDVNFRTPEFRPPFAYQYPYRVNSGGGSDRWFNYYALNRAAGIMQYVDGLTPGQPIRFTTWTELWSSQDDDPAIPPKSTRDGNLQVRVCIDQNGGPRDLTDSELKCSPWYQPYDKWYQISVDATAKATKVMAMIQSRAFVPVQHNDIYADDSCFEILPSAGSAGICTNKGFVQTGSNTGATQVSEKVPLAGDQTAIGAAPAPKVAVPAASAASGSVTSIVPALNIRDGATTGANIIGTLSAGQTAQIVSKSTDGAWLQVTANGVTGYVFAALIQPVAGAAPAPAAASTPASGGAQLTANSAAGLNVRAEPSTSATVVGVLAQGTVADVTGKSADGMWYKVKFSGGDGYVYAALTLPNDAAKALK